MSTQHTPAPWSLGSNGATTKVIDADGKAVCMLTYRKDHWNGDLIAAAPELLAALRAAEEWAEHIEDDESRVPVDVRLAMRAAIARATGGAA
jgi:hypothetical protein